MDDGPQNLGYEGVPMVEEGLKKRAVCGCVRGVSEVGCGRIYVTFQDDCSAVIQGMSQRRGRMNPFEAVPVEPQTGQERRYKRKRVDG
jgi:hypothetical protein